MGSAPTGQWVRMTRDILTDLDKSETFHIQFFTTHSKHFLYICVTGVVCYKEPKSGFG